MTPPEGNTPEGAIFGIHMRLNSGANGEANGTLSRLDEPGAEFPLDVVVQNGNSIHFELFSAAAVFDGELKANQITGEWRQLGADPIRCTFSKVLGS